MPDPAADRRLPPTCEVRDWVVFGPGYHRGALYTPADCDRVPQNFERLKGYLNPVVKLGHDRDQRLADRLRESLGFLNLGDFAAVEPAGNGRFSVTLTNVPTAVGAEINAGRIRSGSVELIPFVADPDDPAKKIRGPVITGVALLGEEHPAVKGMGAIPRAVFADGTPVPPAPDPAKWLQAMADVVAAGFSDGYDPTPRTFRLKGIDYPLHAVCFSEMTPMVDAAFLQSLGLKPDQIDAILAKVDGGAPETAPGGGTDAPPPVPATPPPPGGDGMAAPPTGGAAAMPGPAPSPVPDKAGMMNQDDQTMMSAKAFAEVTKRLGAIEKKMSDAAKASDAECMAAYSDRVELVLRENATKVAPNMRAFFKQMGVDALAKRSFADVTADGEKAFAAWKSFVENLPVGENFSDAVQDGPPETKSRKLDPVQKAILNSRAVKQGAPTLRKHLLEAAKPSAN